jgi:hypothetical protein
MSLLTVVQDFCRRTNGLSVPTSVLSNTDEGIQQVYALLLEEGEDLLTRGDWQQLTKETTHTTVATESQGVIATIASGFERFKNDTFWNRSNKLPIYVVDGIEWQALKAVTNTGPNFQVMIRGNLLLSNPVPDAGLTWAFEYITNNWITSADGATEKSAFTVDTDLILFPEKLVKMGLRWRWKKEKGFEYAEDFRTYEAALKYTLGSNGLKQSLDMGPQTRKIGFSVPSGSWNL